MSKSIILNPLSEADIEFVFSCLLTLRGEANYSHEDLHNYCANWRFFAEDSPILIATFASERIGMLTFNRFAMPRYLGFGVELEEVVVAPKFQGRKLAGPMLAEFLRWAESQSEIRRVQVRTDDTVRAGRVYSRLFGIAESIIYTRTINKL